jgi:hypothetical protein
MNKLKTAIVYYVKVKNSNKTEKIPQGALLLSDVDHYSCKID